MIASLPTLMKVAVLVYSLAGVADMQSEDTLYVDVFRDMATCKAIVAQLVLTKPSRAEKLICVEANVK